jgi:hypothetical protein
MNLQSREEMKSKFNNLNFANSTFLKLILSTLRTRHSVSALFGNTYVCEPLFLINETFPIKIEEQTYGQAFAM